MKNTIEKNRYLELDGTPAESGSWRKFISPWSLTTTFTTAITAFAVTEGQKPATIALAFAAVAGFGIKGMTRFMMKAKLERDGLKDFVVDTKPDTKKHGCTDSEIAKILDHVSVDAKVALVSALPTFVLGGNVITSAICISPLLTTSAENVYLYHRIRDKDWVIIGRGQMESSASAALQSNLQATPS